MVVLLFLCVVVVLVNVDWMDGWMGVRVCVVILVF